MFGIFDSSQMEQQSFEGNQSLRKHTNDFLHGKHNYLHLRFSSYIAYGFILTEFDL